MTEEQRHKAVAPGSVQSEIAPKRSGPPWKTITLAVSGATIAATASIDTLVVTRNSAVEFSGGAGQSPGRTQEEC